jgi:hypothetical protein
MGIRPALPVLRFHPNRAIYAVPAIQADRAIRAIHAGRSIAANSRRQRKPERCRPCL